MNIFRLDNNSDTCAKYHCDRHVVKMPMEYIAFLGDFKHELTTWAHESRANYIWLLNLSRAVCAEYHFRYGQLHWLAKDFLKISIPDNLPDIEGTIQPFINEGIEVTSTDVVENYRLLYKNIKHDLCTWSFRLPPSWFTSTPHDYYLGDNITYQKLIGGQHE
jgi:hypothetical protein